MDVPGILADIRDYLIHRPAVPTRVEFTSRSEREDYSSRIMQRLDISVEGYAILNIHRIGVGAPVTFVFEQLQTWSATAPWWPNSIAKLESRDRSLKRLRVYFLGRKRHLFGLKFPFFGLNVIPLFKMNVMTVRAVPEPLDVDNARYMLYRCSGGYPVGIVVVYVRSPIAGQRETDQTQVFFAVGFNFYGKENWPENHLINTIWETIHNRVTANVLHRFKDECETRFRAVLADASGDLRPPEFS